MHKCDDAKYNEYLEERILRKFILYKMIPVVMATAGMVEISSYPVSYPYKGFTNLLQTFYKQGLLIEKGNTLVMVK